MARFGEILVAASLCPADAVLVALENQALFGGRIGTNLLEIGALDEFAVAHLLGVMHHLPIAAGEIALDPQAVQLVPRKLVQRFGVVPYEMQGRILRLLVADPRDIRAIDEIAFTVGRRIQPVIAAETRINRLLKNHFDIDLGIRPIGACLPRKWNPSAAARKRFVVQPVAADVW